MPAFSHTKLNICQKPRRHSKHTTNIVINDQYNINNKASQTKSCLISYWTSCLTVRFFELKLNGGIYKTEYHNHCLLSIIVTLDILWTHIYIKTPLYCKVFEMFQLIILIVRVSWNSWMIKTRQVPKY